MLLQGMRVSGSKRNEGENDQRRKVEPFKQIFFLRRCLKQRPGIGRKRKEKGSHARDATPTNGQNDERRKDTIK